MSADMTSGSLQSFHSLSPPQSRPSSPEHRDSRNPGQQSQGRAAYISGPDELSTAKGAARVGQAVAVQRRGNANVYAPRHPFITNYDQELNEGLGGAVAHGVTWGGGGGGFSRDPDGGQGCCSGLGRAVFCCCGACDGDDGGGVESSCCCCGCEGCGDCCVDVLQAPFACVGDMCSWIWETLADVFSGCSECLGEVMLPCCECCGCFYAQCCDVQFE